MRENFRFLVWPTAKLNTDMLSWRRASIVSGYVYRLNSGPLRPSEIKRTILRRLTPRSRSNSAAEWTASSRALVGRNPRLVGALCGGSPTPRWGVDGGVRKGKGPGE